MIFHTETVCNSLDSLQKEEAIRAIHAALLQFEVGERIGFDYLDNKQAINMLKSCMASAGYIGYRE